MHVSLYFTDTNRQVRNNFAHCTVLYVGPYLVSTVIDHIIDGSKIRFKILKINV